MHEMHNHEDPYPEMRRHIMTQLFGQVDSKDIQGMELVSLIKSISVNYNRAFFYGPRFGELSGPRMGILVRLFAAEKAGEKGINPTKLSHFQNVKKNTISSLLKGLEDDGYIERTLDANDKRAFMICISQKGRELLEVIGPKRLQITNELSAGLTEEEKEQLVTLLKKLRESILARIDGLTRNQPAEEEDIIP